MPMRNSSRCQYPANTVNILHSQSDHPPILLDEDAQQQSEVVDGNDPRQMIAMIQRISMPLSNGTDCQCKGIGLNCSIYTRTNCKCLVFWVVNHLTPNKRSDDKVNPVMIVTTKNPTAVVPAPPTASVLSLATCCPTSQSDHSPTHLTRSDSNMYQMSALDERILLQGRNLAQCQRLVIGAT